MGVGRGIVKTVNNVAAAAAGLDMPTVSLELPRQLGQVVVMERLLLLHNK